MNNSLKTSWQQKVEKFNALNQRERWMIFAAILCVFYGVFDFLVSPVLIKQKMLASEIANHQTKLQTLNLEMVGLTQKNPQQKTPEQQKIAALEEELQGMENAVSNLQSTLVSQEKMPDLLRDLLKQNSALKLISLKTLPADNVLENKNAPKNENMLANAPATTLPVFKHGVEMTIEGRYLDLLDYVASIEKMPWHVLWESANLVVDNQNMTETPMSQLTLTVYTLSLDKTWLSI